MENDAYEKVPMYCEDPNPILASTSPPQLIFRYTKSYLVKTRAHVVEIVNFIETGIRTRLYKLDDFFFGFADYCRNFVVCSSRDLQILFTYKLPMPISDLDIFPLRPFVVFTYDIHRFRYQIFDYKKRDLVHTSHFELNRDFIKEYELLEFKTPKLLLLSVSCIFSTLKRTRIMLLDGIRRKSRVLFTLPTTSLLQRFENTGKQFSFTYTLVTSETPSRVSTIQLLNLKTRRPLKRTTMNTQQLSHIGQTAVADFSSKLIMVCSLLDPRYRFALKPDKTFDSSHIVMTETREGLTFVAFIRYPKLYSSFRFHSLEALRRHVPLHFDREMDFKVLDERLNNSDEIIRDQSISSCPVFATCNELKEVRIFDGYSDDNDETSFYRLETTTQNLVLFSECGIEWQDPGRRHVRLLYMNSFFSTYLQFGAPFPAIRGSLSVCLGTTTRQEKRMLIMVYLARGENGVLSLWIEDFVLELDNNEDRLRGSSLGQPPQDLCISLSEAHA